MDTTGLTKAQKRNIRRTAKKNSIPTSTPVPTTYKVGDVIIAAADDIEYISDETIWCYKGTIVSVRNDWSEPSYIVKLDLPRIPSGIAGRVYEAEFYIDNLSVTKKRYGEDKYRDIVATNMGYNNTQNVSEYYFTQHQDYVSICHGDIRKYFPSSTTKLTVREALYHSWFVENVTAIGYVSMVVDKKERQNFFTTQDRWNFYDEEGRMDNIKLYKFEIVSSSVASGLASMYMECHTRVVDECDTFVDKFHLVEDHMPYGLSNFEEGEKKMCMIQFEKKSWSKKYIVDKWKVIPENLFRMYTTISQTRKQNRVTPLDTPLYEHLDKTYKELPVDLKESCNTLLWAREKMYEIKMDKNGFMGPNRILVEVDSGK